MFLCKSEVLHISKVSSPSLLLKRGVKSTYVQFLTTEGRWSSHKTAIRREDAQPVLELPCRAFSTSCKKSPSLYSNHRDYSPRGRARVKLVVGGSVSGGQSSQKSQHDGQSKFPSWIQPFIWILTGRTCPARLHKYEVSWTQTFRPCGEQETFKKWKKKKNQISKILVCEPSPSTVGKYGRIY